MLTLPSPIVKRAVGRLLLSGTALPEKHSPQYSVPFQGWSDEKCAAELKAKTAEDCFATFNRLRGGGGKVGPLAYFAVLKTIAKNRTSLQLFHEVYTTLIHDLESLPENPPEDALRMTPEFLTIALNYWCTAARRTPRESAYCTRVVIEHFAYYKITPSTPNLYVILELGKHTKDEGMTWFAVRELVKRGVATAKLHGEMLQGCFAPESALLVLVKSGVIELDTTLTTREEQQIFATFSDTLLFEANVDKTDFENASTPLLASLHSLLAKNAVRVVPKALQPFSTANLTAGIHALVRGCTTENEDVFKRSFGPMQRIAEEVLFTAMYRLGNPKTGGDFLRLLHVLQMVYVGAGEYRRAIAIADTLTTKLNTPLARTTVEACYRQYLETAEPALISRAEQLFDGHTASSQVLDDDLAYNICLFFRHISHTEKLKKVLASFEACNQIPSFRVKRTVMTSLQLVGEEKQGIGNAPVRLTFSGDMKSKFF